MKNRFFVISNLCLTLAGSVQAQQVWDLVTDFASNILPPAQIGPQGAWSYGYDQDTSDHFLDPFAFEPLPFYGPHIGLGSFYYITDANPAVVEKLSNVNLPQGPGGIVIHTSDGNNTPPVIIRWTANRAMTISIEGKAYKFRFDKGNGRTQDFYSRKNDENPLVFGTVTDATLNDSNPITFNVGATVVPGDVIDYFVARTPGQVQGFIGIDLTIKEVPAGAPIFTLQPQNQTASSGDSVTFSAAATGAEPLRFQWKLNGIDVPGATSSTLNLSNLGLNQSGIYTLEVSNAVGSKTSSPAILDVLLPAKANVHDLATDFSLGANPTARHWQYSQSVGNGGGPVGLLVVNWNEPDLGPGQPGWLGIVPGPHAGWARRIDNGNDTPQLDDPTGTIITHGPTSVAWTVPQDDMNAFADLSGNLWNLRRLGRSGSWRILKNQTVLSTGTIDDSSGTSTSPKSLASGDAGAEALNGIPYVPEDVFRLELPEDDFQGVNFTVTTTNTPPDPFLTLQPQSQVAPPGSTVFFTVAAMGTEPLTYQWQKNGTNLPGATGATLTLNNVSFSEAGDYRVVVKNAVGSKTSIVAKLAISQQAPGVPWSLTADFLSNKIPPLEIGPEGGWSYGFDANTGDDFFAPFVFTPFPSHGAHFGLGERYFISASDPGGIQVRGPAQPGQLQGSSLQIHTSSGPMTQPIILRWTAKRSMRINISGRAYKYNVENNGRTQDFFLRKNSDDPPLVSGTVSDDTTLVTGTAIQFSTNSINVAAGDFIDYFVSRTPGRIQGFIWIELTIAEALPEGFPTITRQPQSQTIPVGATAILSVSAEGTAPLNYQWQKDGVNLAGETLATLTLPNVTSNQSGLYWVVVSNSAGRVFSHPVTLTISERQAPGVPWDLSSDFLAAKVPADNIGPEGAWSYGYDAKTDDDRLAPFAFVPFNSFGPHIGLGDFYFIDAPNPASFAKLMNVNLPKDAGNKAMVAHTSSQENQSLIFRWTAKRAMTINIAGRAFKFSFDKGNGRTQDFYLRKNNDEPMVSGTVSDDTLDVINPIIFNTNNVSVFPGDSIDYSVAKTPGLVQGFIGLELTITEVTSGGPVLSITRSANNLTISWPASATGFVLDKANTLGSANNWSPTTDNVVVSGDQNMVTIPITGVTTFYRLKK